MIVQRIEIQVYDLVVILVITFYEVIRYQVMDITGIIATFLKEDIDHLPTAIIDATLENSFFFVEVIYPFESSMIGYEVIFIPGGRLEFDLPPSFSWQGVNGMFLIYTTQNEIIG